MQDHAPRLRAKRARREMISRRIKVLGATVLFFFSIFVAALGALATRDVAGYIAPVTTIVIGTYLAIRLAKS